MFRLRKSTEKQTANSQRFEECQLEQRITFYVGQCDRKQQSAERDGTSGGAKSVVEVVGV
jgi:hypothetical protein